MGTIYIITNISGTILFNMSIDISGTIYYNKYIKLIQNKAKVDESRLFRNQEYHITAGQDKKQTATPKDRDKLNAAGGLTVEL